MFFLFNKRAAETVGILLWFCAEEICSQSEMPQHGPKRRSEKDEGSKTITSLCRLGSWNEPT